MQLSAAKDFITGLVEKNPDKRMSIKQALAHPWLNTNVGEHEQEAAPVAQNLTRHKTAKAQTLYEGCEIARVLTKHAEESNVQTQTTPVAIKE